MMKLNNLALSIALIALSGTCFASQPTTPAASTPSSGAPSGAMTSVNVKALFAVANCTGDNATCPVSATLNAIGDPFNVDVATVKAMDLGTIGTVKMVSLAVPSQNEQFQVFSITPNEGELKGQKVFFALKRHGMGAPGTQFAGKEVVDIFRQNLDNPKAIWFRAGRLQSTEGFPPTIDFTFKPSGNAEVTSKKTNQNVKLDLGVRDLSKA